METTIVFAYPLKDHDHQYVLRHPQFKFACMPCGLALRKGKSAGAVVLQRIHTWRVTVEENYDSNCKR